MQEGSFLHYLSNSFSLDLDYIPLKEASVILTYIWYIFHNLIVLLVTIYNNIFMWYLILQL